MVQQEIILNPWSKQPHIVLAVQGESQARTIITTLIDASGAPLNLTGKTARMYIDKADRTTVFFDGVTQNALNGVVAFTLPLQATTAAGNTNNCQIIVNDATGATLVSYGLKIDVVPSKFNGVLESTSEFTALQEALATVQDIDNRVPKSTTIAGISLQNNITLNQLVAAGVARGASDGSGNALNALSLGGVGASGYVLNNRTSQSLTLINGWSGVINYIVFSKVALIRIGNTQLTGGTAGTAAAVLPDLPVGTLTDVGNGIQIKQVDNVWSIVPSAATTAAWTFTTILLQ